MTTTYPNSTAIPPSTGGPSTDLDANQRTFDVCEAYQRALADDEVTLYPLLTLTRSHPSIQISPPLAAILSLTELLTCSDGKSRHHRLYETFPALPSPS